MICIHKNIRELMGVLIKKCRYFQARNGMSVGSGGRAPFKRTTQNIQPPRKPSRSQ